MPDGIEPSRPRLGRVLIAATPVIIMFLVAGLAIFLEHAATRGDLGPAARAFSADCGQLTVAGNDPRVLVRHAAYFKFAALSEVHLFVCIGVIAFVVVLLTSFDVPRRIKVLLGLIAVTVAGAASLVPAENHWSLTTGLLARQLTSSCPGVTDLLQRQEQSGAVGAALLGTSMAIVVFFAKGSERRLGIRMRQAGWILYAGTLLLVSSVLRLDALYQWSAAAENVEAMSKAVGALGDSLTRAWGIYYTLLLASVYLPSYAIIRSRAHSLVPVDESGDLADKWLKDRGLGSTLPELLPRILAILAPFIVGQASKVFEGLL